MKRRIYDCQPGCPIESTLQLISGKWKCVILYHLIKQDATHFGEICRSIPACSERMLALQLRELIADNIIHKYQNPLNSLETSYSLTEFGQTLTPIISAMETWGNHYNVTAREAITHAEFQHEE